MGLVNQRFNKEFTEYEALYQWSIEHIPDFWATMWEFADIKASRLFDQVIDDEKKMLGARWFSGARLNFAENLLRHRDEQIALIFRGEDHETRTISYAELYDEAARLAKSFRDLGVRPGDRVTGFMPNMPEAITAMLAAASIGAVWSYAPRISVSKVFWIASDRSSPRSFSQPTGIGSREKDSIPSNGFPVS